ncbi:MAG: hypothetical protein R6T78_05060 [Dehalococcoidales bacterium]
MKKKFFAVLISVVVVSLGVFVPAESVTARLADSPDGVKPSSAQQEEEELLIEDILDELNLSIDLAAEEEVKEQIERIKAMVRKLQWIERTSSLETALNYKRAIAEELERLIYELPVSSTDVASFAAAPTSNPLYEELVRIRGKIDRLIALETPPEDVPPPPPEIERPPKVEKMVVYSAKFLCGPAFGDEGVQRGSYSTAVNVHNPHDGRVYIYKKAVIANREDESRGEISAFRKVVLGPDEAIEIDCVDIYSLLNPPQDLTRLSAVSPESGETEELLSAPTLDATAINPLRSPIRFLKGFVVIYATEPVDVVSVYSASTPVGFSLDVEYLSPSTYGVLPVTPPPDEECPDGCYCLTRAQAKERDYTLCEGEEVICGYDDDGEAKYCFEEATDGDGCPEGCVCLGKEKAAEAVEMGYSLCQDREIICGYDEQQNPLYCYERPADQEECPDGCVCLGRDVAAEHDYPLCQNREILCGYDAQQNPLYCYQRATSEDCPDACDCLTQAEAKRLGYTLCEGQQTFCGYNDAGEARYCFEEAAQEECPDACLCLTQSEAEQLGYGYCGGQKVFCGYNTAGAAMYCYEKPDEGEWECPQGCECLTSVEAQERGYSRCNNQWIICGYDAAGNALYCYEEPTGESDDCPQGCACLTDLEAKRLGYTELCQGERIPCDYAPGAPSRWCYQISD